MRSLVYLSSGTKLGPYEIQSLVGAGGMGEVYRARDTRLDRTVAIKVLPDDRYASPELKQRFEREARAISALSHPHICQLYDLGSQDGRDYLVMEYVQGENLADLLRKGPLPVPDVVKIGVEISDALEKAHRQGIVHRDLKPANIMLTRGGAKLMDFGVAKSFAATGPDRAAPLATLTKSYQLTGEGTLIGTLQYMAPEQLEGKQSDPRSDIFALGCVLYEMATGIPAFNGSTAASAVASVMSSEPKPITAIEATHPPLLDRVIRTALAKNPDDRWQSAHDVAVQMMWIGQFSDSIQNQEKSASRTLRGLPWAIALGLLVVAAWFMARGFRTQAPAAQLLRSSILPPSKNTFVAHNFAISPDGRHVALMKLSSRNCMGHKAPSALVFSLETHWPTHADHPIVGDSKCNAQRW